MIHMILFDVGNAADFTMWLYHFGGIHPSAQVQGRVMAERMPRLSVA
jgi:hypothetical protein